jgi:probable F420-dependent oxidoreductase
MRLGAKLRNYGAGATMRSVLAEAQRAEDAGFDSVWLSDHLVMPETTRAVYPYGEDGRISWDVREPWLEPVVLLSALASATERVSLGTAVLVLPLREPWHLAKQLACVQELSGGRVLLGVGDGWLQEELEFFGVPFSERRRLTDRALEQLVTAWSGVAVQRRGGQEQRFYLEPRPTTLPPILVGGSSTAVFDRIATSSYGWLPLARGADALKVVQDGTRAILERRREAGETSRKLPTIVLNAGTAEEVAPELAALASAGVQEVLVDGDFDREHGPERALAQLREVERGSPAPEAARHPEGVLSSGLGEQWGSASRGE